MQHKYQTVTITNIETETPKVKTFITDVSIDSVPGQYVMVWNPYENEKPFGVFTAHPFSMSVANIGPFTEHLHILNVGDKLTFRGPYGNGFNVRGKKLLLVAGGYGGVPLYNLALSLSKESRKNTTVVIGARNRVDLPYIEKFKKLGCCVEVATDDGSVGFKGFSTELASQVIEKNIIDSVYTCGPEVMMKKIAAICRDKKIFCEVSLERIFKCGGIGLCGECSIGGKLVCKDGPVFNGNEI
jgi:dihydroorotate dehydrogenase electron transfer subunit